MAAKTTAKLRRQSYGVATQESMKAKINWLSVQIGTLLCLSLFYLFFETSLRSILLGKGLVILWLLRIWDTARPIHLNERAKAFNDDDDVEDEWKLKEDKHWIDFFSHQSGCQKFLIFNVDQNHLKQQQHRIWDYYRKLATQPTSLILIYYCTSFFLIRVFWGFEWRPLS